MDSGFQTRHVINQLVSLPTKHGWNTNKTLRHLSRYDPNFSLQNDITLDIIYFYCKHGFFDGGKFREYLCKTFHVVVIFTILLFPS